MLKVICTHDVVPMEMGQDDPLAFQAGIREKGLDIADLIPRHSGVDQKGFSLTGHQTCVVPEVFAWLVSLVIIDLFHRAPFSFSRPDQSI
jgi:hypothetical protein